MNNAAIEVAKAINQFHTEMQRVGLSVRIRLLSGSPGHIRSIKASTMMRDTFVYGGPEGREDRILGVPFVEDVDL